MHPAGEEATAGALGDVRARRTVRTIWIAPRLLPVTLTVGLSYHEGFPTSGASSGGPPQTLSYIGGLASPPISVAHDTVSPLEETEPSQVRLRDACLRGDDELPDVNSPR